MAQTQEQYKNNPTEQFYDGVERSVFTRLELDEPQTYTSDVFGSGLSNMMHDFEDRADLHETGNARLGNESKVAIIGDGQSVLLGVIKKDNFDKATTARVFEFRGSHGNYELVGRHDSNTAQTFAVHPNQTVMFGWVSEAPSSHAAPARQEGPPMHRTYRALMDAAQTAAGQKIGRRLFGPKQE